MEEAGIDGGIDGGAPSGPNDRSPPMTKEESSDGLLGSCRAAHEVDRFK